MNLLWFYSASFKKKIFIGNFIIALLTGLVPLLSVWFFKTLNESSLPFSSYNHKTWTTNLNYSFIYFLAICAFFQNLAREISKDIQDISGDKLISVYSLPMKYGIKKTGYFVALLLQIPLFVWVIFYIQFHLQLNILSIILLGISGIINLVCLILILIKTEYPFVLLNNLMKWGMFIGLASLYTNYQ
jgi:4-hydroxybenzoate polyprenyltransferase